MSDKIEYKVIELKFTEKEMQKILCPNIEEGFELYTIRFTLEGYIVTMKKKVEKNANEV